MSHSAPCSAPCRARSTYIPALWIDRTFLQYAFGVIINEVFSRRDPYQDEVNVTLVGVYHVCFKTKRVKSGCASFISRAFDRQDIDSVLVQVAQADLIPERRPVIPADCPAIIIGLMTSCWSRYRFRAFFQILFRNLESLGVNADSNSEFQSNPIRRPTFVDILGRLQSMGLSETTGYCFWFCFD